MAISHVTESAARIPKASPKDRGYTQALRLFHEAAARVPAYKDFLRRHRVRAEHISSPEEFAQVPETDKPTYFAHYPLHSLCWDGDLSLSKYISTSSGSTGVPFFWPRGEQQDQIVGRLMQRIYRDLFSADSGTTLFVDSFSLGTWIAGMEFYNGARWVSEHGNRITIVSPGIDKTEAVNQIRVLGKAFTRIVLAGYPPFVKDILDSGAREGMDWQTLDLRLLVAGESISELWRDRVLSMLGRPGELDRIFNVYGMAECGVVAHETPRSIEYLRSSVNHKELHVPADDRIMGLYQYDPAVRYFELADHNSLVLTAPAGLPLIRYSTRDRGGLIPTEKAGNSDEVWKLPYVYLFGRKDLSVSLYAVNIYIENIKYALERSRAARRLSGLFTMNVTHTRSYDQRLEITVELEPGVGRKQPDPHKIEEEIVTGVRFLNTEYAKLYSVVGLKARPKIKLVPYGRLETVPGRKHRWIKKV